MGQAATHDANNYTSINYTEIYDVIEDEKDVCAVADEPKYPSSFGISLAVPEWEAICTAIILTMIIISTVVGNILVILSVFTYKPLRIVQNFFIVSLAVADLTVAILVLPLNVAYSILGQWVFGIYVCKMWLTCDIMCCTSSILNLCAIALDRYWAITDPINYAQKRTLERVLFMIGIVWILSLVISSPPLLGWNDWPEVFEPDTPCRLTSQPGFVIFSSSGSFYIPLVIMTVVYFEIYLATKKRLRDRAKATKISTISSGRNKYETKESDPNDQDSVSSDANPNEHQGSTRLVAENEKKHRTRKLTPKKKPKRRYWSKDDKSHNKLIIPILSNENSVTDIGENLENRNTSSESNSKETHEDNMIEITEAAPVKIQKRPKQNQTNAVYQFIEEKQRISLTRERRAARTLGIIMGVFVVCWLPFFVIYLVIPFCVSCCLSNKFINFITWLGYVNSALNPLIYTIFNMDFRRAFKKLLFIKC
ncbi:octopamine receptor [Bombyx mandarina]|uniref:Octopamine receptor n=2 Tax=Bombyx TaxID=7090 RepID=Q75Q62_BOMMO|nr:octopamine receptor [Bombyx mandarina]BAD11157.1 tyramine receptor [Bombyx mori]